MYFSWIIYLRVLKDYRIYIIICIYKYIVFTISSKYTITFLILFSEQPLAQCPHIACARQFPRKGIRWSHWRAVSARCRSSHSHKRENTWGRQISNRHCASTLSCCTPPLGCRGTQLRTELWHGEKGKNVPGWHLCVACTVSG